MIEKSEHVEISLGVEGVGEAARSDGPLIVVDVLRASSTIITAMANGALSVLPVLKIQQARSIAKAVRDSMLGGERKGLKIPGFHLGNSPLEYTSEAVHNRNIVFTTTNCTKILERCKNLPPSRDVLVGAFLNVEAVVREARRYLDEGGGRISIVQAGSGGKAGLDDLVCAQMMRTMISSGGEYAFTPRIRQLIGSTAYVILSETKHGRYLRSLGFDDDVRYCSQVSIANVVPLLVRDGGGIPRIVCDSAKRGK